MAFSVGEVFEMACEVERNGARLYREAAQMYGNSTAVETLLALAEWEEAHEQTFALMAQDLSTQERQEPFDAPESEVHSFLRTVASAKVSSLLGDPLEWLGQVRSIDDMLRKAIEIEEESIAFYMGLRKGMANALGLETVDGIVEEERQHVRLLEDLLQG